MTISTLHSMIALLASQFAAGILDAIRSSSLEEILQETGRGGRGRRAASTLVASAPTSSRGPGRRKSGRLARRSPKDIANIVDSIAALLGKNPKGLRAEQIRAELGLEAKELPRPITEALQKKRISKRGHKRATTYFAKAGGRASSGKPARAARKSNGKAAKASKPARGGKRSSKKRSAPASAQVNGAGTAS